MSLTNHLPKKYRAKKYFIITLVSVSCFLVGLYFVTLSSYHPKNPPQPNTDLKQEIPAGYAVISAPEKLTEFNARAAPCCRCKQLRSYEYLAKHKDIIKIGMSKQDVERLLGKPDYMDKYNNYAYCTDKPWWGVPIPFGIQFDENNKVKAANFITFGE